MNRVQECPLKRDRFDSGFFSDKHFTIFRLRDEGYGYDAIHIRSGLWQEYFSDNVDKSGQHNAGSVVVYIPYASTQGCLYKSTGGVCDLYTLIDPKRLQAGQDMIVRGYSDFVFDNTNEESVSNSFKQFSLSCDYHTITGVHKKFYGPKDLWHIKITAR